MENTEKIAPLKVIKQEERLFENVTDLSKVDYILKEYMMLKELTIKGFEQRPEIFFSEKRSDSTYIFKTDPLIPFEDNKFTIFKTLNKHIEVDFEIISMIGEGVLHCKPCLAKIAKTNRKYSRSSDPDNLITASNFMVAKEQIDITKLLGFSGQLIFNDVEKDLKQKHQQSSLVPFNPKTSINEEINVLRKQKKLISITDTETMSSPENTDCIDMKEFYLEEEILEEKKIQFKTKKIKSFIYYPIFFQTMKGPLLIGYCYGYSDKDLPPGLLEIYKDIEENLNKRIMDSNIANLSVKQNIINICEGGMLLDITDQNLSKSIIIKPSFTMDITFKLQPPLRFALDIKHILQSGTSLYVGVSIAGSNDTEKAMESYRSFLHFITKKHNL